MKFDVIKRRPRRWWPVPRDEVPRSRMSFGVANAVSTVLVAELVRLACGQSATATALRH